MVRFSLEYFPWLPLRKRKSHVNPISNTNPDQWLKWAGMQRPEFRGRKKLSVLWPKCYFLSERCSAVDCAEEAEASSVSALFRVRYRVK